MLLLFHHSAHIHSVIHLRYLLVRNRFQVGTGLSQLGYLHLQGSCVPSQAMLVGTLDALVLSLFKT